MARARAATLKWKWKPRDEDDSCAIPGRLSEQETWTWGVFFVITVQTVT